MKSSHLLCLFEIFDMVLKLVSLEFGFLWSLTAAFACVVDNVNKGTRQKKHWSLPLIITVHLSNAYLHSQTVCIMSVRLSLDRCRFVHLYNHLSCFRAEIKEGFPYLSYTNYFKSPSLRITFM